MLRKMGNYRKSDVLSNYNLEKVRNFRHITLYLLMQDGYLPTDVGCVFTQVISRNIIK